MIPSELLGKGTIHYGTCIMNEGETFIRWAFGGQEVQGGWNQRMTAYSGVQTLRTCWLSMTAPAPALHARTPICLPSNTPSSILSPGRPLFPSDLEQLKALHEACFPIQYEKHYFQNAVHGRAGMRSWAAIHPCRTSGDAEEARSQNQVVGFVIARVNSAWDLTPEEHVGLGLAPTDGTHLLYILTFGVHEVGLACLVPALATSGGCGWGWTQRQGCHGLEGCSGNVPFRWMAWLSRHWSNRASRSHLAEVATAGFGRPAGAGSGWLFPPQWPALHLSAHTGPE